MISLILRKTVIYNYQSMKKENNQVYLYAVYIYIPSYYLDNITLKRIINKQPYYIVMIVYF